MKIEQTHYEALPTGEYTALITSVAPAKSQYGDQLLFKFQIIKPAEYAENTLQAWTGQNFTAKSKLFQLVENALFGGGKIPDDYILDTDDLINKLVRLVVLERTRDDGTLGNKIDSYKPATARTREAQKPAPKMKESEVVAPPASADEPPF